MDSAALGLATGSVQGVAWEPVGNGGVRGRLWLVLVSASLPVVRVTIADDWTASAVWSLPVVTSANGLAYDSLRGQIVVLSGNTISWRDKTNGSPGIFAMIHAAEADHLCHDPSTDRLYCSFGANGQNGAVARFELSDAADYGAPAIRAIEVLPGVDAVEGIALAGGQWIVANDAFFHSGSPPLNRLLTYNR